MKMTNSRLLLAVWQSFGFMILLGLVLMIVFRWGEVFSFLSSLFALESFGIDVLIGLASGGVMALIVTLIVKMTNMELPENEMTRLLKKITHIRGGIVTIALGAAVAEEFLFRGALVGLFIHDWNTAIVLVLNAVIFTVLHIPQYKGKTLMHVIVFVMGLWLAFLFLLSYTLWAPIAAHALYNAILGLQLRNQLEDELESEAVSDE
ncbi:hypothetical protein HNR44_000351 [Geomicrobium halophilum]|uniref:CAAX prenyl protease 2/Lysostaphin resistance protein A-like domain-containing protein n=1 Tax=Geomicrobium halophilum TaxID=549000 RepID=A0A841PWM7_9BACL|nr:type II CAAX endopeptidase family protein [Geomicrobium halophilum]MBB6448402.1 hypothetical protein [Geomicrobium halophilum]